MQRLVTTVQIRNNPTSVPPLELILKTNGKTFRGIAVAGMFLIASGGAPGYTYAASGLPAGLSLDAATGEITGTPATIAHNVITATATDSSTNSQTQDFTIEVISRLGFEQKVPPDGYSTEAYSYQFNVTGATGAVTWAVTSGSLVGTGLSLSAGGVLSGVVDTQFTNPTNYPFTVTATDSGTGDTLDILCSLDLYEQMTGVTSTTALFITGQPFSLDLSGVVSGIGKLPYIYSFSFTGPQPSWITTSGSTVSGVAPDVAGHINFLLTIFDQLGGSVQDFVSIYYSPDNQKLTTKDAFGDVTDNPATITIKSTDGSVLIDTSASAGSDTVYDLSTLGDSSGPAPSPGGFAMYDYVVDFGADPTGATDSDTAWADMISQAQTNAAASLSTSVWMGNNAHYKYSGALSGGTENAQLLLPSISISSGEQMVLRLVGGIPGQTQPGLSSSTPLPMSGVIHECMLTSGSGNFINGANGGNFTYVTLVMENMTLRMQPNAPISGIGDNMSGLRLENVTVDYGAFYISGVTQPTGTAVYGIKTPRLNNGASTVLRNVLVIGAFYGFDFNEHTILEGACSAWGCKYAAVIEAGYHGDNLSRFMDIWCTNGLITNTGVAYVSLPQYNIERYMTAGQWYTRVYDIVDTANYLQGDVRYHCVEAGVGYTATFTKNGAADAMLNIAELGTASGGGGTALFYRRDFFTASAGNDTFTRDQSLYADASSTMVITVGGTEIIDTTDFTTAGLVDTMNAPFSGGEIISHGYWTAGSSPAATTLTTAGGGTYGFDPANTSTNITLSGTSNVTATRNNANGVGTAVGINSRSAGKLFFQVQLNSGNNATPFTTLGVVDSSFSSAAGFVGADAHGWGYVQDGTKYTNNVATAYGVTFGDGNIIDVAVDFSGGGGAVKIWFSDTSGAWQASGNPATGANPTFSTLPGTLWPAVTPYRASGPSSVDTLLSRAADLTRSPPSGFSSWD